MAMEVPQCFGYYGNGEFSPEKKLGEQFAVEDLFDFSNEDAVMTDGFFDSIGANSADSSTVTVVDSSNSSVSGGDNHISGSFGSCSFGDSRFSSELFAVPCDELADLEWLSNFVDDSFSTKHNLQQQSVDVVCGSKPPTPESYCSDSNIRPEPDIKPAAGYHPIFLSETPLPSKSRSKRSRAAPCDWTTRLLHVCPKPPKTAQPAKKRESAAADTAGLVTRRCLHCASEKTPQWRTGPLGPKTLCNACGVRFKSGRLVPEYRPAASPTFESTKHSNSHRKVVELRRQKEVGQSPHRQQQQFLSQTSVFAGSNGVDDYLINHCGGPNFRHMI